MQVIINIFVVVGALTFIVAGVTGTPAPFNGVVSHNILVRIIEVMIGVSVLFSLKR